MLLFVALKNDTVIAVVVSNVEKSVLDGTLKENFLGIGPDSIVGDRYTSSEFPALISKEKERGEVEKYSIVPLTGLHGRFKIIPALLAVIAVVVDAELVLAHECTNCCLLEAFCLCMRLRAILLVIIF